VSFKRKPGIRFIYTKNYVVLVEAEELTALQDLLGLVDYSWVLFILLPIVLGVAIGAMPNKKYILWGALITTAIVHICLEIPCHFKYSSFCNTLS
jgi:hypothetical protein